VTPQNSASGRNKNVLNHYTIGEYDDGVGLVNQEHSVDYISFALDMKRLTLGEYQNKRSENNNCTHCKSVQWIINILKFLKINAV